MQNTMNLPEVIDLSSDEEDCMGDTGAEVVGLSESSFPGSDNVCRKDYSPTETVKQEILEQPSHGADYTKGNPLIMNANKQVQTSIGQLDHRSPMQTTYRDAHESSSGFSQYPVQTGVCRQFWKAGDYEVRSTAKRIIQSITSLYYMPTFIMLSITSLFLTYVQSSVDGMDHVRVHPKFLHSNATSHKWALGAIAELLDNAVDEVTVC
eukprot:Gb_41838 [translate_table: standard]